GSLQALDWEQETVDLTAYVGKTVQLVWFYQGYDIGFGSPPQGWLVDDVSITGIAGGGTIVITKNLGQGGFTLSGLIGQTGKAPSTTISNAPPGSYTVKFDEVFGYQTPPNQTKSLAMSGTITFLGNYTFLDANHNGISDAWEKTYFGSVTTNRTQSTDSDKDGMSDYAEFIAGTDPTNAASKFVLLGATVKSNQVIQLEWASMRGRLYQVEATGLNSTNPWTWTPISDWLQAPDNPPMYYSATNANKGMQAFRVQVRP
ncbi:MAG: hypothetical protein NT154_13445, partial [Verrucomicrobia bacterium]|nr:hypothetical protein [Verrucomicrobiota bacterium]